MKTQDMFDKYLKIKALRKTRERESILKVICGIKGHFDADLIIAKANTAGEKLSRASVYRNIAVLSSAGIINECIRKDGRAVYERTEGSAHHDHLICTQCGKIIEFRDKTIEEHQKLVTDRFDFTMQDHRLVIRGTCKECKREADHAII